MASYRRGISSPPLEGWRLCRRGGKRAQETALTFPIGIAKEQMRPNNDNLGNLCSETLFFICLLEIVFVCFFVTKGHIMDDKKLSFEEAYKQLTELVKKMESGELPLADSVAAYEQGIKLKAYCEQLLKEAELKIETLKVTPAQQ